MGVQSCSLPFSIGFVHGPPSSRQLNTSLHERIYFTPSQVLHVGKTKEKSKETYRGWKELSFQSWEKQQSLVLLCPKAHPEMTLAHVLSPQASSSVAHGLGRCWQPLCPFVLIRQCFPL